MYVKNVLCFFQKPSVTFRPIKSAYIEPPKVSKLVKLTWNRRMYCLGKI